MPGGFIARQARRDKTCDMNAIEITLRQGQMPPLHSHPADEELSVLEGRLTVYAEGQEIALAAGESWISPAGVPHTYRATSARVRLVAATEVRAAGSYEQFLHAVAEPAAMSPEDEANLAVLAASTGITVLGRPGALTE
jgi:quercetin dioxygenase-like cupin family protein